MSVQLRHFQDRLVSSDLAKRNLHWQVYTPEAKDSHTRTTKQTEPVFYYFAYGSCMCPVDLKRSLGEKTHIYVVGPAKLQGYRLGFYCYSALRNCGVLDVIADPTGSVEGVLYQLPWRLSDYLDQREQVSQGAYRHEIVDIYSNGQLYKSVRTYVVVNKLVAELAPNEWYSDVVLRGAVTCGLTEQYCWQLFNHMYQLQQRHWHQTLKSA